MRVRNGVMSQGPDETARIRQEIITASGVCKEFPGVRAVDNLDFDLQVGEVHGLVGENGAGKSTFVKILTGVYKPDRGSIRFCGAPLRVGDPLAAQRLGIVVVYQEAYIFRHFSVAENIYIGQERKGKVLLHTEAEHREGQKLLESLGFRLDTRLKAGSLSVAEQRMLEIAKAASKQAKVLILDEPTASLTDTEIDLLFTVIQTLKSRGVSILYISHRLEEVLEIADRITVLRDGRKVSTILKSDVSKELLVEMMVGRRLEDMYPKASVPIADKVLSVRRLGRGRAFEDISFDLHRGEILGLAGLVGAGRTELARVLSGADRPTHGEIYLEDRKVSFASPSDAIRAGIGFLTEDRKRLGLFQNQDVKSNTSIVVLPALLRFGLIRSALEKRLVGDLVRNLRIVTPSIYANVGSLSGGNQQKVVLARWLAAKVKVLILDEPTHGIDVGAKAEIHALLSQLVKDGKGIILISSEFPELLAIADRVLVMYRGRVTGEFERNRASQADILKCACGLVKMERKTDKAEQSRDFS